MVKSLIILKTILNDMSLLHAQQCWNRLDMETGQSLNRWYDKLGKATYDEVTWMKFMTETAWIMMHDANH